MQIEPRSDGGSGARGSDGNYEEASAEMRRLEDEEQIGHHGPAEQGIGQECALRVPSFERASLPARSHLRLVGEGSR